jgi:sensor histidine kinase regulating citrate/malate metabolism
MTKSTYGSRHEKDALSPIEELDSARALIQFLRVQQHDFMNHIQVIHGYLQLNKAHKAMEYIEDIIVQKQSLSAIYKLLDPEMATCLLSGLHKAAFHQVELNFILDSEWSSQSESRRIAALCNELIYIVIEAATAFSGKTMTVRLMDTVEGHIFQIDLPYGVKASSLFEELDQLRELATTVGCVLGYQQTENSLQIVCEVSCGGNKDKMEVAEKS